MDDEMSKELINRIRAKKRNATDEEDESADLIESQAAQIEMMKDTLSRIMGGVSNMGHYERARKALSTTPNEALQAFAEKVREQCAQVCESTYPEYGGANPFCFETPSECAEAIRNLKELPK